MKLRSGIAGKFIAAVSVTNLLLLAAIAVGVVVITSGHLTGQADYFVGVLDKQLVHDETLLYDGLRSKGRALAVQMTYAAADLILIYDTEGLETIARRAEKDPEVKSVLFLDRDGRPFFGAELPVDTPLTLREDIEVEGGTLGRVVLVLDDRNLKNALRQLSARRGDVLSALTAAKADSISAIVQRMALGAFGGGLVLCLVVQFLLNRIIVRPLRRAVKVIGRIALGDTSEKLPMGKAVSCSEIMGCGESRCPSYGTTDHCWVTSGSFAAIRHCSRARKVEDCRDCPVYGAHDELEELGSIINALSDTLGQRKELARHIADGDLTHEVALASDQDAFGEALQDMTGSLRQVLGQVQAVGNKIAASSTHVSNTSQALSQGATQQAGSLEEISSSMVEQGAQTRQNAENASQANLLAAEAGKAAEKGNGQMKAMIEAMGQINESGQAISKIIRTIDDIAFQTNLLALNAAVEAARAGQHGKGFAVVAEEVRNLATRSARAARETSELIEGAVEKTRNGTQIADQTDETLGEIVAAVAKVTNLVAEIASSSSEQSLGIDDVNQRLGQIDQVTQQNAANAEEGAEAAVEMAHQAEQLRQQLARFSFENSRAGNALTASEAQEDTVGLLPSGGEGQG